MGNITLICYVYRDDAEIAKISLGQAKKLLPESRVMAIDDAHRPMMRHDVLELKRLGVKVQYSAHNRNGNLIGPEHTLEHVRLMHAWATREEDIVIKIDPDTLLLSREWIDGFKLDGHACLAGSFKAHINYVIGMADAVRGGIYLSSLVDDVERYPAWVKCFEDFEVSSRLHRLSKADIDATLIHRYDVNGRDGWVMCDHRKANVGQIAKAAAVFNGGFFNKADRTAKAGMADTMRRVLEVKEKIAL